MARPVLLNFLSKCNLSGSCDESAGAVDKLVFAVVFASQYHASLKRRLRHVTGKAILGSRVPDELCTYGRNKDPKFQRKKQVAF